MSKQQEQQSLTWAERPLSELTRLAWPIAVSWLSYALMTLSDTAFVSQLGASQLAGVGLAGILTWAVICFPIGMLPAAKILVSQAVGAGKPERVRPTLGAALVTATLLGALTVTVGTVVALLFPLMTATEAAGEAGQTYLHLRILGSPAVLWATAFKEVRQALGDARNPMKATVIANLVNIGLDYLFIFPLGMGVAGAAAATLVANLVELGLLLRVQRRFEGFSLRGVARRHLQALWRLGWPTGIQFVVEMGSFTLISIMVSRYAELDMAAHQIAIQVIHFSFLPAMAVGEAGSVLVGQAVGAGHEALVRTVARLAMAVAGAYTALCTVVLVLGGRLIASVFTDDPQLIELTVHLFHVAALFQVLDAGNMVGRSALRGTGDVRFPALVSTVAAWVVTPPAMWYLGYQMGLGVAGAWYGFCGELFVITVLFWWRLETGGWKPAMERARQ